MKNNINGINTANLVVVFNYVMFFLFAINIVFLYLGYDHLNIFPNTNEVLFIDFINPIEQSLHYISYEHLDKNVSKWICYLPFAYFILPPLYKIASILCPLDVRYVLVFLGSLYVTISFCSILLIIWEKLKTDFFSKLIFCFFILCSYISIFSYRTGNLALLSVLLTSFFIFFHSSKNKTISEVSLISFSVSIALKLSPAIFILLLLYENKFKAILKVVIYTIFLIIFPTIFFSSELESLYFVKENLQNLDFPVNWLHRPGKNLFLILDKLYFYKIYPLSKIFDIFLFVSAVSAIIISFFYNSKFQRLLLITLLLVFVPKVCNYYNLLYLIPAIILFFNEENKSWNSKCVLTCFIFNPVFVNLYNFLISPFFISISVVILYLYAVSYSILYFKKNRLEICKKLSIFFVLEIKNIKKYKRNFCVYIIWIAIILSISIFSYKNNTPKKVVNINDFSSFSYVNQEKIKLEKSFRIKIEENFKFKSNNNSNFNLLSTKTNLGLNVIVSKNGNFMFNFLNKSALEYQLSVKENYKFKAVVSEKSVASILFKFDEQKKEWIVCKESLIFDLLPNSLIEKISIDENNKKEFDDIDLNVEIINRKNHKIIILITLLAFIFNSYVFFDSIFYCKKKKNGKIASINNVLASLLLVFLAIPSSCYKYNLDKKYQLNSFVSDDFCTTGCNPAEQYGTWTKENSARLEFNLKTNQIKNLDNGINVKLSFSLLSYPNLKHWIRLIAEGGTIFVEKKYNFNQTNDVVQFVYPKDLIKDGKIIFYVESDVHQHNKVNINTDDGRSLGIFLNQIEFTK